MKTTSFRGRVTATALAVCTSAGALLALPARPAAAKAEDTWRYVTYGAGAATVLMGANKKWLPAAIGAGGTYLSYRQWQKEKNKRQDRQRYDDRFDRRGDRYDDRFDRDYRRR